MLVCSLILQTCSVLRGHLEQTLVYYLEKIFFFFLASQGIVCLFQLVGEEYRKTACSSNRWGLFTLSKSSLIIHHTMYSTVGVRIFKNCVCGLSSAKYEPQGFFFC